MRACLQGGLQSPRIVQHAIDHATTLSLVSCRLGVAFVSETARWQRPRGVTLLPVFDLDFPVPFHGMGAGMEEREHGEEFEKAYRRTYPTKTG
jgi:hypothetical protein